MEVQYWFFNGKVGEEADGLDYRKVVEVGDEVVPEVGIVVPRVRPTIEGATSPLEVKFEGWELEVRE